MNTPLIDSSTIEERRDYIKSRYPCIADCDMCGLCSAFHGKDEMASFEAPLLIIASDNDIFFPAEKVFSKAKRVFKGPITTVKIDSKHLPSEEAMIGICKQTTDFLN